MAKTKAKYNIKYGKDTNECNSGAVVMKRADGSFYCLSYSCNPEMKVRSAKAVINSYFEERIPEFIAEFPGATNISWDEYTAR